MSEPEPIAGTPAQLADRARAMIRAGDRALLGLTGPPAAGKSTLAAGLAAALAPDAVLVAMDGFHLANAELDRLGRREVKGAPDTFDAAGFRDLVRRLRTRSDAVVYAALFDRGIEESIAGTVPVAREVPLVVVEGNYLLLDEEPWREAAALFDEVWYVDLDDEERLRRLTDRHVRFGRSASAARARATGSDQRNAELIAGTRSRATRTVRVLPG